MILTYLIVSKRSDTLYKSHHIWQKVPSQARLDALGFSSFVHHVSTFPHPTPTPPNIPLHPISTLHPQNPPHTPPPNPIPTAPAPTATSITTAGPPKKSLSGRGMPGTAAALLLTAAAAPLPAPSAPAWPPWPVVPVDPPVLPALPVLESTDAVAAGAERVCEAEALVLVSAWRGWICEGLLEREGSGVGW